MNRRAWFILACAILISWQLYHVSTSPEFFGPPLPIGDGPDYEAIGFSLSTGRGFSFTWDDPDWKAPYLADPKAGEYPHLHRDKESGLTTSRPPLVPIILAAIYRMIGRGDEAFATFRSLSAVAIGLAGALAVAIAFEVSRKIFPAPWIPHFAAVITLSIAILDGTIRTYAVDFLSEPLALLWTTLFLACGLSLEDSQRPKTKIVLLALTMTLMIATRSMFVLWIPGVVVILLLALRWQKISMTISFVALVAVLLSPWWLRNCQRLQSFMPMGAQGAASIRGGYSDEALADNGNWHPDAELRLRHLLFNAPEASEWSSLEFERRLAIAASMETWHWIQQHIRDLPYLGLLRIKTHWGPYFGKSLIWRVAMLLGILLLLVNRRWEAYWFLGLPMVSSLVVMTLYETGGRFLVPLYGLLYALAGIGVAGICSWLRIHTNAKT